MPELFGRSVGTGDGVVALIEGTGVGVSAGSITGAGDRCAVIMTAKNPTKRRSDQLTRVWLARYRSPCTWNLISLKGK